mgnify:CR=1 FL=1
MLSASVDFMAQKVYADCDGATLEKVKDLCNHFEEVKVVEDTFTESADGEKIKITGLCCGSFATLIIVSTCQSDTAYNTFLPFLRHFIILLSLSVLRIKITGLCCANCARELEEDLNKLDGVTARRRFLKFPLQARARS